MKGLGIPISLGLYPKSSAFSRIKNEKGVSPPFPRRDVPQVSLFPGRPYFHYSHTFS
jgi:hypothetical protein